MRSFKTFTYLSSIVVYYGTALDNDQQDSAIQFPPPPGLPPMYSNGEARTRLDLKMDSIENKPLPNLRGSDTLPPFKGIPSNYFEVRSSDNCTYPLEVMLLQDISASFTNDMPAMISTELPQMYQGLASTHPGSTFGAISFVDKPVEPFGWPHKAHQVDDFCYRLDMSLGEDVMKLLSVYMSYKISGGNDHPENQYGAMVSAVQDSRIGWGSNPMATRLLVLSTDSPPHYDDEVNSQASLYGMKKYSGRFDEENIDQQCKEEYYPSWQEAIRQLTVPTDGSVGPYVAFLVWDEEDPSVTDTYKWIANSIGENDSFVRSRGVNSTGYWDSLSRIIRTIDSMECQPDESNTTTSSTTGPATTDCPYSDYNLCTTTSTVRTDSPTPQCTCCEPGDCTTTVSTSPTDTSSTTGPATTDCPYSDYNLCTTTTTVTTESPTPQCTCCEAAGVCNTTVSTSTTDTSSTEGCICRCKSGQPCDCGECRNVVIEAEPCDANQINGEVKFS